MCYTNFAKQSKYLFTGVLYLRGYGFFALLSMIIPYQCVGIGKSTNSIYADMVKRILFRYTDSYILIVWRQPEFVFFVRELRLAHFFIGEERYV